MSKRLYLSIISTFLAFISISLYGCIPWFTWKPEPVKTIQAVTYVLPKNENINTKDSYIWYRNIHGIQFPLFDGEHGYIFRTDFEKQNNLLLVEKKGTRDSVTGSIYHVKCEFAVNRPHSYREILLKSKYKVVRNDGTTATVEITHPDGEKEQMDLVHVASGWKVIFPAEMLSTVPSR